MVAKPARRRQRAAATLPSRTGIAQGASSTAAVDSVTGGARKGAAPRSPRPDRPQRRGPSPHSPFAGLAALLADVRKD